MSLTEALKKNEAADRRVADLEQTNSQHRAENTKLQEKNDQLKHVCDELELMVVFSDF